MGPERSEALLAFHVLTGCDQTGRFCGKSKSTWWKYFIEAGEMVWRALSKIGTEERLPTLDTLEAVERFVVSVYGGSKLPENVTTLADLPWIMFSKCQHEAEKLPPTFSTLKYKIFRTHFVTMVLRRSHVSIQNLPPAINYGWEDDNDSTLVPIMTNNLPAPLALIELSVCSCQSNCTTKRCKCKKNKFLCTDMCKCRDCHNDDANTGDDDDEDVDLSDDDDF